MVGEGVGRGEEKHIGVRLETRVWVDGEGGRDTDVTLETKEYEWGGVTLLH